MPTGEEGRRQGGGRTPHLPAPFPHPVPHFHAPCTLHFHAPCTHHFHALFSGLVSHGILE